MKLCFLVFLICFSSFALKAQDSIPSNLLKANLFFAKREYLNAIDLYLRCAHHTRKYIPYESKVLQRLGDCYRMLNNNDAAEKWYAKAVQNDRHPSDSSLFYYAEVLKKNQKYPEAKAQLLKLTDLYPDSLLLQLHAASCDSAIIWSTMNTPYNVYPLKRLNSEYSDITAVPFDNGIVFSSNREDVLLKRKSEESNDPFYNLFFAKTDSMGNVKSISSFSQSINSSQHENAPFFNSDYSIVYYTANHLDKDNVLRLKLYSAEYKKNSWKNIQGFFLNDSCYSFAHPSIDRNNKMFFFASDLAGGYGGTDIYVCFNIKGKWSDPVNLGPVINTPGNELYPFYHESGMLYFSSNAHQGLGGYDIFEASQKNGEWISIANMKMPINSSSDDFGIYLDETKEQGYFSSNRPEGSGTEDIYRIEKK